ncbi:MAG: glycosyltransferase [Ilumatobacteraceae bacterium]
MTMRVAVNLLWCIPGQVGGSEEYLARQLQGLTAVDPGADRASPTLFTLPTYPAAHPELADRFPIVSPRFSGQRRGRRVIAEHTWLRRRARAGPGRSDGFDLVHHGGGTAPMTGSRPTVLTIHDLQYLEHPHFVSPRKLRYLRAAVPRSVARASIVAVPSEFVRGTVVDALGVDPDRVVVVPHGIDAPAWPVVEDEAALRARWGLGTGPVLVYPAITHPHKNHRLLLDTMRHHWADEPDLRLVLLGGRGAADAEVERAIHEHGLHDRVVRPRRV